MRSSAAWPGLAERRGPAHDSFWTWREVMYRFLGALTPDDVEAIAAFAYMQMLEAGFTAVGEFHYLHHDIDGRPYADLGEMAARIAAAASATGIGLTLLPTLYMYGGFGGAAPNEGQKRFLNDPDRYAALLARSREIVDALPDARVGIAPHSLRAVTPEALRAAVAAHGDGPIHIHAAEQTKEVADCIAALKTTPVAWLLDNAGVDRALVPDPRDAHDRGRDAPARGVGCGRGALPAHRGIARRRHLQRRGAVREPAAGSASGPIPTSRSARRPSCACWSIRSDCAGTRAMSFAQEGESTGARIYAEACKGGAQALGRDDRRDRGRQARRHRGAGCGASGCDAHRDRARRLCVRRRRDAGDRSSWSAGEIVVAEGRHKQHDAITARYRKTMERLSN